MPFLSNAPAVEEAAARAATALDNILTLGLVALLVLVVVIAVIRKAKEENKVSYSIVEA